MLVLWAGVALCGPHLAHKNLKSLMDQPGTWIDRVGQHRSLDKLILDLNPRAPARRDRLPGVSETFGRRERSR